MSEYSEDKLVQQTTVDYLKDALGWNSVYAYNNEDYGKDSLLGRKNQREVVLTRYLREALEKFNSNLPAKVYEDAIKQLTQADISKTILGNNEEKYNLLKNGVKVKYKDDNGRLKEARLKVFDFENPKENHFLAVRELWIQGKVYRRRPDIMGFVNGLPLLFIECKNIYKELEVAYRDNFTDYKDTIPEIFHHNAFVMLSNGSKGEIGSITSPYEYFNEWKRLEEEDQGNVDFKTMLDGVCNKANFLDLFENFILYDDSKGKKVKIIARNHQFLGVNRAIESVRNNKGNSGKLGVFWHTQGSGKSYSMLFFGQKIHRKFTGNYTFVIMTDRKDLDDQIYKTFLGASVIKGQNMLATSGKKLARLLKEDHRYIFSLVHKFNQDVTEPYSIRDDIIVISDEAHRTQQGRLARNMRDALPNASFIGFTGTPLFRDDEITRRIFGDYVSEYPYKRAVDDNATVPLYYENRGEKLGIVDKDINQKLADKIAEYDLDPDQEAKLERELKREYHIITGSERLEKLAKDFVTHYSSLWTTGKAMLVCIDKLTCVKMYNLIDKYWKEYTEKFEKDLKNCIDEQDELEKRKKLTWLKETEYSVIVSEEQNEVKKFRDWKLDIVPHREKMKKREMDKEFKDDSSNFRIAIVCAMWLTGFDVESLSTLYLDKPLKGHTLMQAIARANRVYEGKNNGLIVDYSGMLKSLRKALALYATGSTGGGGGNGGDDPVKPEEELFAELEEAIKATVDYLKELGFNLQSIINSSNFEQIEAIQNGVDAIYTNDESKRKFEILAREVFKKFKAVLFNGRFRDYAPQHDAIEILYKNIQENTESADISHVMQQLQNIVDQAVVTEPDCGDDEYKEKKYDISNIDFERLRAEFPKSKRQNTAVKTLKDRIEAKLKCMISQNPLRIDYYEKYKEIVNEYNEDKDRLTIQHVFDELLKLAESLSEEETRAVREGLNEEYLAIFDLLKKEPLISRDVNKIKQVAKDLLETLKKKKLNVDRWKEKESTIAAVDVFISDYLFEYLPETYTEADIETKAKCIFNHIYDKYNTDTDNVYAA